MAVAWLALGVLDAARGSIAISAFGRPLGFLEALERTLPDAIAWILLSPVAILFAKRFPLRRPHLVRDSLVHLGVAILVSAAHLAFDVGQNLGFDALHGRAVDFRATLGYILPYNAHQNILVYAAIVGLARFLDERRRLEAERSRSTRLQQDLAEARLRSLQSRLRPHFLFNALHTGAGLVERDPRAARALLQRLGDLLRQSLNLDTRLEITLAEEVAFLRKYLEVESQRFGERLQYSIRVDPAVEAALVPTFVLQPIVENAVRHGVEKAVSGGHIELEARRDQDVLQLTVRDDGPGLDPAPGPNPAAGPKSSDGPGIGIATTRARLEEMYPGQASLSLAARQPHGTCVEIRLPWHQSRLEGAE